MTAPPCPHGIDAGECPACAQEQYDRDLAVRTASRDPETVETWRAEFESWLASAVVAIACRDQIPEEVYP